jgi:AcrR family transcriptional regulator
VPNARARSDATERILQSAATRIALSGATVLTMQEVADAAGVSKALIHYHFHDKDTLLTRLVSWMASGLVRRERAALAMSTPQTAIDDLWRWLESELARGHIRALVELAGWRDGGVRAAASEAMRLRRQAATSSAERLFTLLALRSRVPVALLGDLIVTFIDGAAAAPEGRAAEARVAFDVLWLALLGLAE